MSLKKILWVLEDDPNDIFIYTDILSCNHQLRIFNKVADFVFNLKDCVSKNEGIPDMLICDINFGEESFLDFLNSDESIDLLTFPFIIVSDIHDINTLRHCFNEGATDYLAKPFSKNELLVKIERLLEKNAATAEIPHAHGAADELNFDAISLSLKRTGCETVLLTAKQVQLYGLLDRAAGAPVSKESIEKEIWGGATVSPKALDVHVFHLRKKLKKLDVQILFDPKCGYTLKIVPIVKS